MAEDLKPKDFSSETEVDASLLADLEELQALAAKAPALEPDEMDTLPAVFDYETRLIAVKANLDRFRAEIQALEKTVFSMSVKSTKDQATIAEYGATSQKLTKAIKAAVDKDIEEPKGYIQSVKNFADEFISALKRIKAETDRKWDIWAQYEKQQRAIADKKAAEAIAKLQAAENKAAEKKGVEPVKYVTPQSASAKIITRTDSGSTFEVEKPEITIDNEDEVERIYCSPDIKKLKAAVDGGARGNEIKGCTIKMVSKPQTRTR